MDGDPYAILGLEADASLEQVVAAWRRLVKEWHPDLRGDANALARMAQINAAYETILGRRQQGDGGDAPPAPDVDRPAPARAARPSGWWLAAETRRRIGPELIAELHEQEPVERVVRCYADGSDTLLLVTDRRLLWLLDDRVLGRVRSLPLATIRAVERPSARPWRRSAAVRVRGGGSAITFAGLEPAVADALAKTLEPHR